MRDVLQPHGLCPPGTSVHGILQARILEGVAMPSSRGSSQPRDRIQVSTLWVNSLLAEPPGKPKNTGVGSLSLLQWIFLTQELNWGLLHCRRILYQLGYQRISPIGKEIISQGDTISSVQFSSVTQSCLTL